MDAGGNIAAKNEEKTGVLNTFFVSVFNSQTSYPQHTQASELEGRNKGQNEFPITQEDTVSELLLYLDAHRSMGLDGVHPRVQKKPSEELTKPLSIIYWQPWLIGLR